MSMEALIREYEQKLVQAQQELMGLHPTHRDSNEYNRWVQLCERERTLLDFIHRLRQLPTPVW